MNGLLNFIRKEKRLRELFGKRELEIMEKQLLGISLSRSETTRLSRDIRSKLGVIRELSEFKEEFGLKKGAEIKYVIEEAKDVILKSEYYHRIKRIILFGSTVSNQRTFRSDIDIAVEFDEINLKDATKFRLKTYINDKVDIQVYNVLPEKIKKEVDKKGKLIWKRE
jgi:predicted nucleotidyltransferase